MTKRFVKVKFDGFYYVGEGETQPLAQKLGYRNRAIFEVMCLHQNENCICSLAMSRIAELSGISLSTVKTAIAEMKDFTYEGKPIFKIIETTFRGKPKNEYFICENPLFSQYGEINGSEFDQSISINGVKFDPSNQINGSKFDHIKEKNIKEINKKKNKEEEVMREMSPKEVVNVFLEKNKGFKVVWSRDMRFAKKFLESTEDLVNNDKKKVIELIVDNYEKWSSNSAKYPLTVNTLSLSWVQQKARDLLNKEKENLSRIEEQSVVASKRNEDAVNSIMERLLKNKKELK